MAKPDASQQNQCLAAPSTNSLGPTHWGLVIQHCETPGDRIKFQSTKAQQPDVVKFSVSQTQGGCHV